MWSVEGNCREEAVLNLNPAAVEKEDTLTPMPKQPGFRLTQCFGEPSQETEQIVEGKYLFFDLVPCHLEN